MKKQIKQFLAFLLALVLTVQIGEVGLAAATEDIRIALDPTSQIELSTPDDLSEGNWFFIRERQFEISEKSEEKLYVPIQRAGDLSEAASVTLKLADITSHFDVNYKAEIFRVEQEAEAELGEFSLVDAIHENQDTLAEVPELSEEEMEELIAQQGETEITDAAGNKLGTISPEEGTAAPAADPLILVPEEVKPAAQEAQSAEETPAPVKNPLQAAREAFTGTVSDRQAVESSVSWMSPGLQEIYDNGDDSLPEVEQEEETPNSIPGYVFTLDYAAGESVKFLVITPLYSDKADGDSSLMLTLEVPDGGFLLHEDFFTSYVNIKDEDEPEQVVVSFSQELYTAEEGKVTLTVTRQGAINEIVTVMVATYDGSAQQGADYSGVGAKLYFPMGLESRTLEIPVGHAVEEKDFYVTITPVSECTAGIGTARVVIPAVEQEAELMVSDAYIGEPFSNLTGFGGATPNGSGGTFSATDTECETVGYRINNGWGLDSFFYDGVRLTWSADIPRTFCGHIKFVSNTYNYETDSTDKNTIHDLDNNTLAGVFIGNSFNDETIEHYFGKALNPWFYWVYTYCSDGDAWFYSPSTVTLHSLEPIKREFTFEVLPADLLGLRGIPEDDERQINGVYVNSSLTDTMVTVLSGGSFTLTAQNSSEYSRFVGIDVIGENGSTYRIANSTPGTRTMRVEVTESMINALANRDFITWSNNYGVDYSSMKGTIKIKPIFEKIPAKVQIDNGTYGYFEGFEDGGEYNYYLGERITLKTVLNDRGTTAGARGSGIGYYKATGKEGVRLDQSNNSPYLNNEMTKVFQIDQAYTSIWPVFDTTGNAVTVQIRNQDLQYFDTTKGSLAQDNDPNYNPETDTWTYFVADDALINQVMLLTVALDEQYSELVPLWSDTHSNTQYSGTMFPIRVGADRTENVVKLSVNTDKNALYPCAISGTVQAQEINLATGRPSGKLNPAEGAMVFLGMGASTTDGNGRFALPAARVAPNTWLRYAVSYNGALTICETRAPGYNWRTAQSAVNIGLVEIPSFSTLGAHITDVYAMQNQHYMTDAKILEMNGQRTELAARVSAGEGYMLDGVVQQENILGVTFFFLNPLTNELHGEFEAQYDDMTDTWRVDLEGFTPDRADEYTYGDILYAQLYTDKKLAAVYDAESGVETVMSYDPVSTGYSVISDADYDPTLFNYNVPVDAASMFAPGGIVEQGGGDPELCNTPYDEAELQGDTRVTYGEFPFIGELDFILHVAAVVGTGSTQARMLAEQFLDLGGGDLDSDDAELQGWLEGKQRRIGIAMKFASLPYGGTRFVFALTVTMGNAMWDMNMSNPWQDTGAAARFFSGMGAATEHWNGGGFQKYPNGAFGAAMFSLTFAIGFYIDFGYLNITTFDDSGHSTTTHQCVYLGGGGLAGFIGNLSTTAPLPPFPIYAGVEAEASIMIFLGAGKNPRRTIEAFKEQDELDGIDFDFQYQLTGSLTGKGVLGVGFDHALGLRGNLGVKIELCYSPIFQQWFPSNYYFTRRPFSFGSSLVMSGYLDLVFMSLPLATFTYPIAYHGYLWLFNQMRIGARVANYVQGGINDMLEDGTGDEEVIQRCVWLCNEILRKIENFVNPQSEADELREYAYEHGVINGFEYYASFSAEIGGLLGMVGKLLDDEGEAEAPTWSIQSHAASQWVAGDSAELMAAFSPVTSRTVVENSREQTSARLLDLGNNRLLLAFLDDDASRSEVHASVLTVAVYNTESNIWELSPTVVQPDDTGDYMPDLCDAEDDVILTWVSTAPDKVVESENDPTNHMDMLDVFSLRLPKSALISGSIDMNDYSITQLTDDEVYDSTPRAVFDNESKDVLVLYTKTMPDTDYAPDSVTRKVLDYAVGGEKVYSVNAYMLYDAAQGDWVRDYLYPNESSFTDPDKETQFLQEWGGQRFVRISVDGQSDPAISEMTVSRGYNGLAVYAYTVDKDFDTATGDDSELYIQFYDFRTHSTYVPIRLTHDNVSQAMPTLTRTSGGTYLFWLENSEELKYVDISAMLRAGVCYNDDGSENSPAVLPDGTFAEGYTPAVYTVDMTSLTDDEGVEGMTGFTVLTNEVTVSGETYDDLYVIWTSGETYEVEVPESRTGETRTETCKEIYAAAMIHEGAQILNNDNATKANWSKPYRLTEDHKYHDGVTAAIDSNGDLYLVHNEFDMIWHGEDEEWLSTHLTSGVDQSGQTYYEGDCYEYTQTNLVMTRCIPVGSLEVTKLELSDTTPLPGDTVTVTAVVENTGLTTAYGCDVRFYETVNGNRGRLLHRVVSDNKITVNNGKQSTFEWELPNDLEGIGIECVVAETDPRGGDYFDPITTEYSPIELKSELKGEILSITQKGDVFEADISVVNSGNIAAEEGTEGKLYIECLYGNAKEVYGVDDDLLAVVDLSGLAPGAEKRQTLTLEIPASVFDYCSYDAVTLHLFSAKHDELDATDQFFVCLDEPMDLVLDNGNDKRMTVGESRRMNLNYSLSPFRNENTSVVYSTGDPSVAMVIDGSLVAVEEGTTSLTATLLPYGNSTTVNVYVTNESEPATVIGVGDPEQVTVTEKQVDNALEETTDGTAVIDLSDAGENVSTAQIPAQLVQKLADAADTGTEQIAKRAEIALPAGTVTLDADALETLAKTGEDVLVTVNAVGNNTKVDVTVDGKSADVEVQVALPAARGGQVLVIVKPDGTEEIVKKSAVVGETVYGLVPAGSTVRLIYNEKDFPDVADDAWYKDAVDFVSSHGLFQGTNKGFEPGLTMDRAMLATVLYRLEGAEATGENPFADVPDNTWYTDAVIWASNAGIITGAYGNFNPDLPVTREQIAVMFFRYADHLGLDTSARASLAGFSDGGKTSSWAEDAMQWAVSVGLFQGNAAGSLNPKGEASRAEVAVLLERMVELIVT